MTTLPERIAAGFKAAYDPDQWRGSSASYGLDDVATGVSYFEGVSRDYFTIYRTQAAVRQAIAFIAENVAQVPLKVYDRIDDADRAALSDHGLQRALDDPHPELTAYEFKRDLVTDLELFDVTYWGKVRVKGGGLVLVRLYPDAISFKGGSASAPAAFRETHLDGTFKDWPRADVLWLHGYGTRRGVSQMETLREILAEDEASSRHRRSLYKNGMRQLGVIERPADAPAWTDKGRRRFIESIQARYSGGANAGRPLLLEEGMTWKGDQVDLRQAEYIAERQLTMTVVAQAMRIAPEMLGIRPANYGSISAYNAQLYQNALAPRLEFISQGLSKQLLPEFAAENQGRQVYVDFNLEAKLRGSFEEQAQAIFSAVGGPWMTPDEARALRNLSPLPDGAGEALLSGGGGVQPGAAGDPFAGAESDGEPSAGEAGVSVPPARKRAQKAAQRPAQKAERGAIARRSKHAAAYAEVIDKTFERAARQAKATGMKAERFARELATDLRPVAETITVSEGSRKAGQLGAEYDPKMTAHYLDAGAKVVGENVAAAFKDILERHPDDAEAATVAGTALAARVGLGQATHLMAFAREEAGKQAGVSTKTWTVTSSNSRHPEMDGDTAKLGEEFSNGLAYPGDPAGDPDDTAGCTCVLDITSDEKASSFPLEGSDDVNIHIHPPAVEVKVAAAQQPEPTVVVMPPFEPPPARRIRKTIHRDADNRIVWLDEEEL